MTHLDVTLTDGSVADLNAIMTLFDDAVAWLVSIGREAQWGSEPWSSEPNKTGFVRKMLDHGETTLARLGDEVVGALVISPERIAYAPEVDEPEIYIHLLMTSPSVRGKGVGARLLELARSETRQRGIDLLRVDCWAGGDRRLVRYYESAGFTPTVEVPVRDTSVQVFEQRLNQE